MERTQTATSRDLEDLESLTKAYPWCATFQLLKTMGLKEQDDIKFKAQLGKAAAYAGDRSKLYDYVLRRKVTDRLKTEKEPSRGASTPENIQRQEPPEFVQELVEKQPNEGLHQMDMEPLEEQIMRAAITHIGELEIEQGMRSEVIQEEQTPGSVYQPTDTFGAWLLKIDGRSATEELNKGTEKILIEKFIQESPQISPVKKAFFSPSQMGKLSLVEDESFVSETLAKIYEKQGDYKKASRAYRNLGLKYPEKSSYFAALQKKAEAHLKNS